MAVAFRLQIAKNAALAWSSKPHGGPWPDKAANISRNYEGEHLHYMRKYFLPAYLARPGTLRGGPEQQDSDFERRFRMPKALCTRVFTATVASPAHLCQDLRPGACTWIGTSPLLKVICALCQLAYGLPSDLADDLFDV